MVAKHFLGGILRRDDMPKTRADHSTAQLKRVVARHLRAAMDKKDVKGRELASQIGVGPQTLSDWRKGRYLPSVENLLALAKALREPVSFLVGDAFHGVDSLEALGRQLGTRLGQRRAAALTHVSDADLRAGVDALIGRHVVESGPISPARRAQANRRTRKNSRK